MSASPYMIMSAVGEVVCVPFRFQAAAAGGAEPDFQMPAGTVANVIRAGSAGLYNVTFREKYPVFLGVVGTVLEADEVNDLIVKAGVGDYDPTTGVLALRVVGALDTTSAGTDVTDNDWVFVVAYFVRRTTAFGTVGAIPA